MDRSFRELGVGDMSVGKEMKKVGAALLGRKASYTEALAVGSEALAAALVKNIYRGSDENQGNMLAKYVEQAVLKLNSQKCMDSASVSFEFPSVKTE
jgi:cytochrome b pre-mRNA-processing protein 3